MTERKDEVDSDRRTRFYLSSSSALGILLAAIYLLVLLVFCIVYKIAPGPEFIALCFVTYAAYAERKRRFVRDWVPFILLFLSYEAMYGIAYKITGIVHIVEPIDAELRLFGTIPTLFLQHTIRTPFLDYMGAFFYSLHFVAPTVFAFVLWKFHSRGYWRYMIALAVLTYSSLMTFLIYPVAPPWYGVGAQRILFQVDAGLGVPIYKSVFDYMQPNPFAAFQSLHSAFPWLISLFALKIGKKKALPILVLPFGVWFGAVYLGEHYAIDVFGGIAYATVAFFIAEKAAPYFLPRLAVRKGITSQPRHENSDAKSVSHSLREFHMRSSIPESGSGFQWAERVFGSCLYRAML